MFAMIVRGHEPYMRQWLIIAFMLRTEFHSKMDHKMFLVRTKCFSFSTKLSVVEKSKVLPFVRDNPYGCKNVFMKQSGPILCKRKQVRYLLSFELKKYLKMVQLL